MSDVHLTRQLTAQGLQKYDLRRLVRTNELERVRRGAYAIPLSADSTREQRHRRLLRATLPQLEPGAVLSHGSAALVHGLPTWSNWLGRVHVTRSGSGGGQRRAVVHVHVAPLLEHDVEMVDGLLVTSLQRTVLDLARSTPFHQAVAVGDRALALGVDPANLQEGLLRMTRWPGVRGARRTCGFLDPRSESPGESVSRVRFVEQGIPEPELQYEVYDDHDNFIGRCDFEWEEFGTLGEFDGKVKYGRLLRPGRSIEDVVYEEKLREDALRDQGWQVVRWTWGDLDRADVIRERLHRAFNRSTGALRRPA
jgi:hypothetical protein